FFFFSSRRRHTRSKRDWSSDVCSSDLEIGAALRQQTQNSNQEHPYAEWIAEYSGTEFQTAAQAATERLDELTAGTVTTERFDSFVEIFRAATRLEAAFWQQALVSAA